MGAMCTKFNETPEKASRPFDAELAGYGATCDAHHITTPAPEGAGLARCLDVTLKHAGVEPSEVVYVNAHGTSTAYNDKFETMALKTVFGDHAQLTRLIDKGRAGPHHGRRRRHRGRADVSRRQTWRLPADHKPRDAGPGLRPELCF